MFKVNSLICKVITINSDQLVNFLSSINNLAKKYSMNKISDTFFKLIENQTVVGKKDIKDAYQKNYKIINSAHARCSIYNFMSYVFAEDGTLTEDYADFINYLHTNYEDKNKIAAVIDKIYDLGIQYIVFDEEAVFDETQSLLKIRFPSAVFAYMDNIEVLPNDDERFVKYISKDTPYLLPLEKGENNKISVSWKKGIKVNSLSFDPNRLPASLNMENTFNKILLAESLKKDESKALKETVDLSVALDDLRDSYNKLRAIADTAELPYDKEELNMDLNGINFYVNKTQDIIDDSIKQVVSSSDDITQETFISAKKRKIQRRIDSQIDID